MKRFQELLQPGSVSHSDSPRPEFEFRSGFINSPPNDVVFCGKTITRKTEPGSAREGETTFDRNNAFLAGLRSPSGRENRSWRGGSDRKSYTGIFGTVKFPLQMELSDIKMRQEKRELMPVRKFTAAEDGGDERCWEVVPPLRRRGSFFSSLKSSFRIRCISIA